MIEHLKTHIVITFPNGHPNEEIVKDRAEGRKCLAELSKTHTPAFLFEKTMGMEDIFVASNYPFMQCRVCTETKSFHCNGFKAMKGQEYRCENCGCAEANHGKFDRSRYPYKFRQWSKGFEN